MSVEKPRSPGPSGLSAGRGGAWDPQGFRGGARMGSRSLAGRRAGPGGEEGGGGGGRRKKDTDLALGTIRPPAPVLLFENIVWTDFLRLILVSLLNEP